MYHIHGVYPVVYSICLLYLGLAGRLAGWLCWQRSKTVVTRWRTVAPAVVEIVGSCRVETVLGGRPGCTLENARRKQMTRQRARDSPWHTLLVVVSRVRVCSNRT